MYEYKAEILRIVDGDTLEVLLDLGFGVFKKERVRLARVDTPETYGVKRESAEYLLGKQSTEFVINWAEQNDNKIIVKTLQDKRGSFNRYLVEVYGTTNGHENVNLNDLLLSEGLAELYK